MSLPDAPKVDAPASEWLVYADALQQQGDPRGELIALVHANAKEQLDAHVRAHAEPLLGAAAKNIDRLGLSWSWCFVDAVSLQGAASDELAKTLSNLLDEPIFARLRALTLVGVGPERGQLNLSSVIAQLVERPLPATLHAIALVDARAAESTLLTSRDMDASNNRVAFGSLEKLLSLEQLRSLKIVTADVRQLELGAINAPNLRSFTLHGLRFADADYGDIETSALATTLAAAKWPMLEEFDLRACETWIANIPLEEGAYSPSYLDHDRYDEAEVGESEGADWNAELGGVLNALKATPLRRLALTSFGSPTALLEMLSTIGLPATLEELDLSDSALSSRDLPWFVTNAPLLAKLRRLVVKNTALDAASVKALEAIGPMIEHTPRAARPSDDADVDADDGAEEELPLPQYRYVVGAE